MQLPPADAVASIVVTFIVGIIIGLIPADIQARWKGVISLIVTAIVVVPMQLVNHVSDFMMIFLIVISTWLAAMGIHQGAKSVIANK